MKSLRGTKIGMTQIFQREKVIPMTLIQVESDFQEGERVRVSGISKGKGFQGAVKRHGFSGRNATHGVKHEQRTLGSVGTSFPERVTKGRKMPGRMGGAKVTVKNLQVVKVDKEHSVLGLKGAVPGARGTLVEILRERP